ncbi:hypothetical protein [Microvirga makkahensis]|uniref:Uncharacterized protein n=1 Tax=Microvirga makkahensis TaxID=1128670 RepID=A0A7X3MXT6_9HYPH|nr:hypothetical protein [Microvirga makkahensis]MXQ14920.1 hypothetical protein [Microvirga makkahensis]
MDTIDICRYASGIRQRIGLSNHVNLLTDRSSIPAAHGQHKDGTIVRLLQRSINPRQKQVNRELDRLNSMEGLPG